MWGFMAAEFARKRGADICFLANINANLVATWLRKREAARADVVDVGADPVAAAFIAVPMAAVAHEPAQPTQPCAPPMTLQARLPNGVSLELQGTDAQHIATLIESLGRLRCSASTKG